MKLSHIAAALAAALAAVVAAPAVAGEPQPMSIQEVSQLTGVKQSSLRVLLGARSSPGIYPLNYSIARRDYRQAMQRIRDHGVDVAMQGDSLQFVRVSAVSQVPASTVL